jgi:iron uptake system component EfeO
MKHRFALAVFAACAVDALAACGDKPAASDGAGVAITATDSTCEVAKTTLDPGAVTFTVTNKGNQATEVYVYGDNDGAFTKVITEVENIGPGLTRDLTATLAGGKYEIACKPGQTGDGIRTPITVTGAVAASAASASADAYDREIEIEATPTGIEGADGLWAKTGEKIEFKLENKAAARRELEIVDPAGKVVTEIEADANGAGETVVILGTAGTWTLKIAGAGMTEVEKKLTVS